MLQMKSGKLLQIICDRQSTDKRAQGKQATWQAFGKLKGHYSSALFHVSRETLFAYKECIFVKEFIHDVICKRTDSE